MAITSVPGKAYPTNPQHDVSPPHRERSQAWNCRTKDGRVVRRDQLVRKLKANYFEDIDFTVHKIVDGENREKGRFATIKYFLTIECFKMMGMQVSGERGNEIRRYFLNQGTKDRNRQNKG